MPGMSERVHAALGAGLVDSAARLRAEAARLLELADELEDGAGWLSTGSEDVSPGPPAAVNPAHRATPGPASDRDGGAPPTTATDPHDLSVADGGAHAAGDGVGDPAPYGVGRKDAAAPEDSRDDDGRDAVGVIAERGRRAARERPVAAVEPPQPSVRDRVLTLLRQSDRQVWRPRDVATLLDPVNHDHVRAVLVDMSRSGELLRPDRGRYMLARHDSDSGADVVSLA